MTKLATLGAILLLFISATAHASEEEILAPKSVTMSVDAGKPFGQVQVTLLAKGVGKSRRIFAIRLVIGATAVEVPATLFNDLENPNLSSLELRREVGYDEHPWLYVTFLLGHKPDVTPGSRRVYLAVQNGKLVSRSIKERLADGQFKFEKKEP